jgi:hypothetical protein
MGRLTLNILLSFAQFEREVTGERIRDKIAASRQKGMWMGGTPPLGYNIKDKKLFIVPEEAEVVRFIFQEYLAASSTVEVIKTLKKKDIKTKSWTSMGTGKRRDGGFFNKGMLYKFLHNKIYIGEAVHKGKSYPGEHGAIISKELFDKVQDKLHDRNLKAEQKHQSHGLLKGLLFDVEGRSYSPTYTVRKNKTSGLDKYHRYYVSQKAVHEGCDYPGIKHIGMEDIDRLILENIGKSVPPHIFKGWDEKQLWEKRTIVQEWIDKIIIHADRVDLLLKTENGTKRSSIPVQFRTYGGRKLILDADGKDVLPARANKNNALMTALIRAHKWERTMANGRKSLRSIAIAEDLEQKYVGKIYRLNFLAPKIKEAILDGMQPRTLTLSRLMEDIPLCWEQQARLYGF